MNLSFCKVCSAAFMAVLTNVTILLVLACISHQLVMSDALRGAKDGGDEGWTEDKTGTSQA